MVKPMDKPVVKPMDKPLIVIAGATATGKTDAAVALALARNGEVVSADSMQVYRYMDIGTAKPTAQEMRGVSHHMLDVFLPDEECNVARYKELAQKAISEIRARNRLPIIAGGTGFYINALLRDTAFDEQGADEAVRQHYEQRAQREGAQAIYALLEQVDPAAAKSIHPNNIKRVVRALEYFETTGKQISAHNQLERSRVMPQDVLMIVLEMARPALYERINRRVDKMMEMGLEQEVRGLLARGYDKGLTSMQGIGYKEMIEAIDGAYSLTEAVQKIQQGSRRYAKRQVTWFRHQVQALYFDAETAKKEPERFIKFIENELEK